MRHQMIAGVAVLGLALAGTASAQEAGAAATVETGAEVEGPMPVIRAGDPALTCRQISDEAAQHSQAMGGEPDAGVFGALGGVARSGAALLIPGARLVMAGADAMTRPERERGEAEALAVQNRWYYLNGLYAGRRCQQQAEAAEAAAPSAPPVPAPPTE